ncbi:MAG: glycosyltransferase family 2 protein [Planctomycetia bacterium]
MSHVTFVIPVFREAENIPDLVAAIAAAMASTGDSHDIVFVDDGSPDDTWRVLRNTGCRAIRLSRNFGKEAALAAGLDHAQGDAVIIMDADFQHPPSLIPVMIERWKSGRAAVVEAVKADRGSERAAYRVCASIFYSAMKGLSGLDLRGASDYKLLDKKVVAAWRQMPESNLFFRGMSSWVGFTRESIPFHVQPRQRGVSGWNTLSLLKLAASGVTSFTAAPLHFVTAMGGCFMVVAIVLGARAVVVKMQGRVIDGFTLVILLLLVLGSMILVGLGIIGEYIARIYVEVKGRPRYVVGDRTGWPDGPQPGRYGP